METPPHHETTRTARPPQENTDAWFPVTRWSVVQSAGHDTSPQAAEALEQLCEAYWFPLYAYVRHQDYSPHDAQDLTQGFFAAFLKRDDLSDLAPDKGRFRAFMLACLKHFISNERDRARALKRGGGKPPVSWDELQAEERYQGEPSRNLSPDRLFEKQWALALLERVLSRLASEQNAAGKAAHFDCLKCYLTADKRQIPYAEAAESMNMTEGAVKVAVHRMRRRYRELLRDEVAQTVASPDMVDDELHALFAALGS